MEIKKETKNAGLIEKLFKVGAHFAYAKTRRHPSAKQYIFGIKNKVEIFDLEKTAEALEKAKNFVKTIASNNGQILFVGGKSECKEAIERGASSIGMPFVAGRWIGGTLTNFVEIRKRILKMEDWLLQKEKGELSKYTKKERLLIDREIDNLKRFFGGIASMKDLPKVMFVVDTKREHNAVSEAKQMKIHIVSLSGSDCDMKDSNYVIPGNDASVSSIKFFVDEIVNSYKEGKVSKAK